jgi:hypothetical protein
VAPEVSKVTVQEAAFEMLEELRSLKLEVCKIQTDSGYIRCVVCPNPKWYSGLCQQWTKLRGNRKWRRPRTIIKRVDTLKALKRIASNGLDSTEYSRRLLPFIQRRIESEACRETKGSCGDVEHLRTCPF